MGLIQTGRVILTDSIASKLVTLERYCAEWKKREKDIQPSFLAELRNIGSFESIGSSNRIGGNTLSDE